MRKLVVIGAGGHGRAVISTAVLQQKWDVHGVIDINYQQQKEEILGVDVIGGLELIPSLSNKEVSLVLAIGDNNQRRALHEEMVQQGFDLPNVVHPSAQIAPDVKIGEGNYIGAMAHIGPCAVIGRGNIVNTLANMEHEAVIGDYNHVAPSSVLCGRVCIEDLVLVGANATVLDKRHVVKNTVIGAGSVIIESILEPNQTVVGVPGRAL